jgi:hypothetical protein
MRCLSLLVLDLVNFLVFCCPLVHDISLGSDVFVLVFDRARKDMSEKDDRKYTEKSKITKRIGIQKERKADTRTKTSLPREISWTSGQQKTRKFTRSKTRRERQRIWLIYADI